MKELDFVRLTKKYNGLPVGMKGTIIHVYKGPDFEVEFFDEAGDMIDLLTIPAENLELVQSFRHKSLEERAAEFGGELNLSGELDWKTDLVGKEIW